MLRLDQRYNQIVGENPLYSTYLSFIETIRGENYPPDVIKEEFDNLVDTWDYAVGMKKEIIEELCRITKPSIGPDTLRTMGTYDNQKLRILR